MTALTNTTLSIHGIMIYHRNTVPSDTKDAAQSRHTVSRLMIKRINHAFVPSSYLKDSILLYFVPFEDGRSDIVVQNQTSDNTLLYLD